MSERRNTAQALRGAAKTEAAWQLERARVEAGASQAEVAAALGVCKSQVQQYEDPAHPKTWGAADLVCMPTEVAARLLPYLAEAHGRALYDPPAQDDPKACLSRLESLMRETSEAVNYFAHSVTSDGGVITPQQAARLSREIDEAIGELVACKALAMRADRERGLRMVRPWDEEASGAG